MPRDYSRAPGFGTPLCVPEYYVQVDAVITTLRYKASQSVIADHLNNVGFRTPRNHPWNRQRVAQYLRSRKV